MLRRLLCRFGRHRRSVWLRYRDDDGSYVSRCRGCEVPMRRDEDGRWTAVPGAEPRRPLRLLPRFRRRKAAK